MSAIDQTMAEAYEEAERHAKAVHSAAVAEFGEAASGENSAFPLEWATSYTPDRGCEEARLELDASKELEREEESWAEQYKRVRAEVWEIRERLSVLRVFKVRYLPQTETRPTRLSIHDLRYQQSKIMSKQDEFRDVSEQAMHWLEKERGITIEHEAEEVNKDGRHICCLLMSRDLRTQLHPSKEEG